MRARGSHGAGELAARFEELQSLLGLRPLFPQVALERQRLGARPLDGGVVGVFLLGRGLSSPRRRQAQQRGERRWHRGQTLRTTREQQVAHHLPLPVRRQGFAAERRQLLMARVVQSWGSPWEPIITCGSERPEIPNPGPLSF